jgi:hypothetical protein
MRTELDFAILFHETYERLAPSFGYETRPDTRAFDPESKNGRLMLAVMREVVLPLQNELNSLRVEAESYGERVEQLTEEHIEMANQVIRLEIERNSLKPDAEKWKAYEARKEKVIGAGMGRNPLRKESSGTESVSQAEALLQLLKNTDSQMYEHLVNTLKNTEGEKKNET